MMPLLRGFHPTHCRLLSLLLVSSDIRRSIHVPGLLLPFCTRLFHILCVPVLRQWRDIRRCRMGIRLGAVYILIMRLSSASHFNSGVFRIVTYASKKYLHTCQCLYGMQAVNIIAQTVVIYDKRFIISICNMSVMVSCLAVVAECYGCHK